MTECRDCLEPIQFLPHPKTGKLTPYDDPLPAPPNHYQSKAHRDATKESRNGRKPAKIARSTKPMPDPMVADVVAGLVAQGIKQVDAARYVAAAGEAVDVEALLRAALAQKNVEMVAKESRR